VGLLIGRVPGEGLLDIKDYLKEKSGLVDSYLMSYFDKPIGSVPPVLMESMKYSLLAGGKRIRPILAMSSYEACGGRAGDILHCASAIEVIHTYSLIHDDLPAMDDDDLRRGRPTNHKVYGDAVAILAGDGLLTEAFLMILNSGGKLDSDSLLDAIRELSTAAGIRGMVGGQVQDILSEKAEPDAEVLRYIHMHKTGMLIRASVRLGGILYGADPETMKAIDGYGENLGIAFQIVDDILDVRGDESLLGKPVGSDAVKSKMTYPALYGIESSQKKAEELITRALKSIESIPERARPLREIARYILERQN
jgi:geranylgeranyl diphosphate synthase type II